MENNHEKTPGDEELALGEVPIVPGEQQADEDARLKSLFADFAINNVVTAPDVGLILKALNVQAEQEDWIHLVDTPDAISEEQLREIVTSLRRTATANALDESDDDENKVRAVDISTAEYVWRFVTC